MPVPPTVLPPSRQHRPPFQVLRFARAPLVQPALERLLSSADRRAHVAHDPVELVHRQRDPLDQEIVGLVASAVAYGRVDLFKPRLARLVDALGPEPARFARSATPAELLERTAGFAYRMTGPAEVSALLYCAASIQQRFGSLGALAQTCLTASSAGWREALDRFVATLWKHDLRPFVGQIRPTRRLLHLVASPGGQSACKRLNLFARWMVRPADGVDLGLWPVAPSLLVIPLDTHVHRIARFLGLTRRTDLSWKTAEEITARLRHLDPDDPVKFDFALSHLGISGDCPAHRDAEKCARCPLRPICRMWDRPANSARRSGV